MADDRTLMVLQLLPVQRRERPSHIISEDPQFPFERPLLKYPTRSPDSFRSFVRVSNCNRGIYRQTVLKWVSGCGGTGTKAATAIDGIHRRARTGLVADPQAKSAR